MTHQQSNPPNVLAPGGPHPENSTGNLKHQNQHLATIGHTPCHRHAYTFPTTLTTLALNTQRRSLLKFILLPHPYTREFISNIWPPQVTPTSQNANKLTTPNWHKIHSANWFKIYSDRTHNSKHKRDIKRNTRQQERFTTSTVTFSHHRTWLHRHKATN